MATTRIKDISKTTTDLASDTYGVFDGATNGTQKMARNDMYADWAAAYTAAPTTYKLAPLNSGTNKIDATYLPVSGDTPKGEWNASTNSPSLIDGTGTAGDYYDVTTAGSQDLGSGSITFTVGDVVKYDGSVWYKIDSVANFLDGYSTAATSRTALEVNSIDEDAEATGTKLVGPALYFDGVNDYLEVADDDKLTFSSLTEFGKTTAGTWSPEDNTPALTDGTGTLNDHYKIDADGTVAQGGSTLSIIDGTSVTAGQVVYYDGSVWRVKDCDDLPFSVSGWIRPASFTNNRTLASKWDSSKEWRFYIDTNGKPTLSLFGSASTFLTSDIAVSTDEWVHISASYAGAGPNSGVGFASNMDAASIYINGELISSTATNNASYTGMGDTAELVWLGRQVSTYFKGSIRDVKIFNRELTATEVAQLARGNDLGFADEWGGALGAVYTSDFSNPDVGGDEDLDGFTATAGTVDGNIDSIGGLDDNLRFTADNTLGTHFVRKSVAGITLKRHRVLFDYYIPSGQSNIDGLRVRDSSSGVYTDYSSPALGQWNRGQLDYIPESTSLRFYALDGGNASFQDAGGDDVFYIRNVKVTEIGTLADFRAENFIADKLIDLSSNNFVGTNNGATLVGGRKALQLDTDGAAAGNNVLSVFNGSSHLAYVTDKGDLNANSISSGASTELTIATGAVTATKSYHTIDTESDAASDDLDTISGGRAGQILVVQANNSARSVVLKDGTGNLKLSGDITLDNAEDTATLVSDGTSWYLIATSNNGA